MNKSEKIINESPEKKVTYKSWNEELIHTYDNYLFNLQEEKRKKIMETAVQLKTLALNAAKEGKKECSIALPCDDVVNILKSEGITIKYSTTRLTGQRYYHIVWVAEHDDDKKIYKTKSELEEEEEEEEEEEKKEEKEED